MAISYPTQIDEFTNPVSTDGMDVVPHAEQHSNANDAIEALERQVGVTRNGLTPRDGDRLLMHNRGVLQAPTRLEPLGRVWWVPGHLLCPFDAEQGGYPVVSVDENYNPVALTLGSVAAAGPWFTATEMWIDQTDEIAHVSATFTAPGTTWSVYGSVAPSKLASGATQRLATFGSSTVRIDGTGHIMYHDGTSSHVAASTLATLLGVTDQDQWEFRVVATATSADLDVRLPGGSWVSAVSGATVTARNPNNMYAGNASSHPFRGRFYSLHIIDSTPATIAHFTPALFPAGNRADGDTAVDAYGVTWTVERPDFSGDTTTPRRLAARSAQYISMPGEAGETVSVARGAGVTTTEWVATYFDGSTDTGTTAADPVVVGGVDLDGDVVSIELRDGVSGPVYDTLAAADADPNAGTWVSPTSGATVTIDRAVAAQYHAAVIPANTEAIQTDGVDDRATVIGDDSTTDFDPASEPLTVAVDFHLHDGGASYGTLISNADGSSDGLGFRQKAQTEQMEARFDDSATALILGDSVSNVTYGARAQEIASFGSSDHAYYHDGAETEASTAGLVAFSSGEPWYLGAKPSGANPGAFTIFGFAVVGARIDDAAAATIAEEGLGS